jgi:hypothetical protein
VAANHKERKHALLSASGASRWMNCTPSARLEENFIEEESTVYAAEGTLAHEFADLGLQKFAGLISTRKYNAEVKKLKANELYDPEMDKEVQKYLDFVIEEFKVAQKQTEDAILSIEEKLDLTAYIEEGFGTGDAIIIADGVLKVIDLKYGKGVRVDAENNPQLKLYGLGALEANELFYDINTVEVTVVQPRLDHIDSWPISAEGLKAWAEKEVKPKAELAYQGDGLQYAGDWCKFCKAAPRCATLAAANLKLIDDEFADPHLLSDSQLLEVYGKMGQIQNWIKAVTTYLLKEAIAGKEWPGYKLVSGRSLRKWANEDEVIQALKELNYTDDDIMSVKLQGITAIEKLLGKKQFSEVLNELVIKPQGAPTLVNKSDKRPEWSSAEQDFKDE